MGTAGRPKKNTVDYFPHDAVGGKTLFILQNRYGNDGYACWFKLLALLCRSPGHFYNCNRGVDWQFLAAEMALPDEKLEEVLNCLSELEAIDPELWATKVIWCQNLVDRLAGVYRDRQADLPIKPPVNGISPPEIGIKPPEIRQSKVKESKLKESNRDLPEYVDQKIWNDYLNERRKNRKSPTEKAIDMLLKKLAEFREAGDDPNEVLSRSIMNGWTGIFPLDKKGVTNGTHQSSAKGSARAIPKTYTDPSDL